MLGFIIVLIVLIPIAFLAGLKLGRLAGYSDGFEACSAFWEPGQEVEG